MTAPAAGWPVLMSSVGLTFFAYSGFGMMANASASVSDPGKTMPRAILVAIVVVIALYLALAAVVLGNLSTEEIRRNADSVVAAAARPVLGQVGYVVVAVGGLLATASATNATVFSILNLNLELDRQGNLPRAFGRVFLHAPLGFLGAITLALAVVLAFPLSAIANLAGLVFLIAYMAVFEAHWRLRREAGGRPALIILGAVLMGCVLIGSVFHLSREQPGTLAIAAGILAACVAGEWWVKRQNRSTPGPCV